MKMRSLSYEDIRIFTFILSLQCNKFLLNILTKGLHSNRSSALLAPPPPQTTLIGEATHDARVKRTKERKLAIDSTPSRNINQYPHQHPSSYTTLLRDKILNIKLNTPSNMSDIIPPSIDPPFGASLKYISSRSLSE